MQTQPVAPASGKPALRSGAIIGIALGIIHSVITIIITQMTMSAFVPGSGTANPSSVATPLYLLVPLIWIIGFLFAGAWPSTETGSISTGTLAGLFAGIFGGIVAGFGEVISTAMSAGQPALTTGGTGVQLFTGYTVIFFVIVLAVGAGAGVGAIGGLIGQSISKVRPQPAPQPAPVYAQPLMPYPYAAPQPMPAPMPVPQTPQVPLPQQPETPRMPEQ